MKNRHRFPVFAFFLAALSEDALPFNRDHQAFVRDCMFASRDREGSLYVKSGWGIQSGKDILWLVGWLEGKEGRFFFATRIEAPSDVLPRNFSDLRRSLSLAALDRVRNWTHQESMAGSGP